MKVIKPVVFTESMLVASNVPEGDHPAWASGTTYGVNDLVVYGHTIYESAQAGNTGNVPPDVPLYWLEVGPTNRYRMFDSEVNTQTVIASQLEVTVAPGLSNSLALLEVQAAGVQVTVRNGLDGPVLYERHQSMDISIIADWYEYFFEPLSRDTELVLTDLPPYGNMHVTVVLTEGSGLDVACGALLFGSVYEIGKAERGASAGIIDYSRKDTGTTGTTRFLKRRFSRRSTLRTVIDNSLLNKIHRLLSELRAT